MVKLGGFRATRQLVDRFLSTAGGVPFSVGLDPRDAPLESHLRIVWRVYDLLA